MNEHAKELLRDIYAHLQGASPELAERMRELFPEVLFEGGAHAARVAALAEGGAR